MESQKVLSQQERLKQGISMFMGKFRHLAGQYKWQLVDGWKLRARAGGQLCCPLVLVGYVQSSGNPENRYLPNVEQLGAILNLRDDVIAAIIHNADDIRSRYYDKELRQEMESLCSLGEIS